jgi:hypothetical protein
VFIEAIKNRVGLFKNLWSFALVFEILSDKENQ